MGRRELATVMELAGGTKNDQKQKEGSDIKRKKRKKEERKRRKRKPEIRICDS